MVATSNYQDGFISTSKSPNLLSDVLPLRFSLFQLLTVLPSFQKLHITLKNSFHFAAWKIWKFTEILSMKHEHNKKFPNIQLWFFFPSLEGKAFHLPTNLVPQNPCLWKANTIISIKYSFLMLSVEHKSENNTTEQIESFCKRHQNLLVSPYSAFHLHQNNTVFLVKGSFTVGFSKGVQNLLSYQKKIRSQSY